MRIIQNLLMLISPTSNLNLNWLLFNIFFIAILIFLLYHFRKNIFDKRVLITILIIVFITFTIYFALIKDKDFFSYDETDSKYYYSIVRTLELRRFEFFATTIGFGYLYLLMDLFLIFNIRDIFATYILIVVFMFVLFVLFNIIAYFFFKKRGFSTKKTVLVILAIITNMSFLMAIFYLKVVYFMVFLSILLCFFLLKRIEKKNSPLLNLLFITNYIAGAYTRPEFFAYTLVFAFQYIKIKLKAIKSSSNKRSKLANSAFLIFFALFLLFTSLLFYEHSKDYSKSGFFWQNFSYVIDNFIGNYNATMTPVFFTIVFLLTGLTDKKSRLNTLLFLSLFLYQFNPLSFDIVLLNFYCLIVPIVYFYNNYRKKTIYIALIFSLLFNASIIGFAGSPFQDGKQILELYYTMIDLNATVYVPYPTLFFGFLFKGSNVEVYGPDILSDLKTPTNDYIISGLEYVPSEAHNNLRLKFEEKLSTSSGFLIYKLVKR